MRTLQQCLGALVLTVFVVPAVLGAQQQPAGVVTTLQGTAELTRPTQPLPTSLRFKDAIFVRDVINTKEKSIARVLFGGKSTVTVRELSRLEVREENLSGGATRSIHELSSGAILVNIAKQLMRPGDEVQIRTPNAVAAVRGTILYVDCSPARANPTCKFTVLTGEVTLTPQGRAAMSLPANSTASVTGSPATGIDVSPVTAIAPTQATQILQQFDVQVALTKEVNQQQIAAAQAEQASQLARAVVATITGTDPGPTPGTTTATQTQDTSTTTTTQTQDTSTASATQTQQSSLAGDQQTSANQQSAQEDAQIIQTALVSTSSTSSTEISSVTNPTTDLTSGSVTTAPVTPVIEPQANLSVTRTATPASVTVGSDISYTITVTNVGPSAATGVVLTDSVPAGTTFVSATASQGSCGGEAGINCNLGNINSGSSSTVTVTVTATAPGTITETATVSSSVNDPVPADNTVVAQTTILPAPPPVQDLVITGATDPNASSFNTGAPVTFRTITQSGGALSGTDAVTASSAYDWTGGIQSGAGSTNITTGATLTISGPADKTLDTRTLNNAGTATFSGGPLFLNNGALFNNSGTFNAQDNTTVSSTSGPAGRFTNTGTFSRSGVGTTTTITVPFDNTGGGSVQINSGTLSLAGGGTSSGSMSGAGTLTLDGNYTFAPGSSITTSNVLFNAGTANVQGSYDLAGSNTMINGGAANFIGTVGNVGNLAITAGSVNFSGDGTVAATSLTQSGGLLTGSDAVNVSALGGASSWTGGSQSGSGTTNVQAGATLDISGGATKGLDTRTLNNAGTTNVSGATVFLNNGALINNTGSFNIVDGVNFSGSPGGTINNSGTFTKSGAGTSTTLTNVQFNNSGSADVQSGTLRLSAAMNNSGTMQAENGAALEIKGPFTNTGTIAANTGATVSVSNAGAHTGAFNVSGNLNLLSGLVSAAAGQTLNPTGTILNVNGGTVTANGATPLFNLTGGILNVLGANKFLVSMTGGGATLGGKMLGLTGGSSATVNSLFTLSGNSSLAVDTALVSVAGGSSLQVTGNSLGNFGSGTNTLTFTNAAACSSGICVPINSSGFNILLTNGAVIANVSIDPTFVGFSGLGGTNSVAGTAGNQAIIVVDGATSRLSLGPNALPNLVITGVADSRDFSAGTNPTFFLANISGGTLTGSDTVSVVSLTTWTGGTQSGTGVTNANGGMNISGPDPKFLDARTLNSPGVTNFSGGNLALANGATFNNTGTFNALDNANITGTTGIFNNSGLFAKSGAGTATEVLVPFNNTGTGSVQIDSGSLRLAGGGTGGGSFSGAGTLDVASNYTFSPASNVTTSNVLFESGTANVQGTYNLAGSNTTMLGGTANFTGTVGNVGNLSITAGTANFSSGETIAPASLAMTGGTLTGSDTVTLTGPANSWTGGTQSGSGATNVQPGATLDVSGTAAAKFLDTRTVNNAGTVNVSGSNVLLNNGAAINNSGLLNVLDGASINGSPSGTINNSGTFTKSGASTSTTLTNVQFNNSGSADVQSGTLRLSAATNNSGTMQAENGAALEIQGPFTNTGTIAANTGGTVNVSNAGAHTGAFNVSGNLNLLSGLVSAAAGQTLNPTSTILNVNGGTVTNGVTPLFNLTGGVFNLSALNSRVLNMTGGNVTLNNGLFSLTNGSSATINSLFSIAGGGSFSIVNNALLNVSGGSVFRLTSNSLGSFGAGTNTLSFGNAPLCGTSCVQLGNTGFNVLLSNGAVITNISIDPDFNGFAGLGGTNTVAGLTTGGNRALIILDGSNSQLLLGQNALQPLIITAGTTDFSGGTNPFFASANISGGVLTGSDTVTINGLTSWSGGTMSGGGVSNANGGLEISGAGTKTLDTRTLNSATEANLSGGSLVLTNGATLNAAGPFNNTATLDVQSGTAILLGGGTNTGTFNVESGSMINFSGGVHDLNSGAALTGGGEVRVIGTVNLNDSGIDQLAGTLNVANGSLNVRGDLVHLQSGVLNPTGTMVRSVGATINVSNQDVSNLLATPNVGGQPADSIAIIANEKATVGTLEWAYIPVAGTGQVNVIDVNANNVIKTVSIGAATNPATVAATPDQDRIYVLNSGSAGVPPSVSIIDVHPVGAATANNVVATLSLGNDPNSVVFTPDSSKAFITNSQSGTVTIVDNSTAVPSVITTIAVGTTPKGASVTPDGTKVYVANAGSNTVSVINTATNAVVATVNVGTQPIGLAVSPDGTKVGVVNKGSNSVSIIDVATNTLQSIGVGATPSGGAIMPNGKFAYVSNQGSGTVSVINMATNTRVDVDAATPGIQDIAVGTNPTSVVISTDSRRVYVANAGSNSVSVIDTATNNVVGTINFASAPTALALARETADLFNLFVVNDGSSNVSVVHVADTSDLIEVAGGSTVAVNNNSATPALSFGDAGSSTTVNTAGSLLRIRDAGSSVTVQGPILSGSNTTFNVDRGFLRLNNGGSLFAAPGSSASFGLSGSTPGASAVNTVASLFSVQDSNTTLITGAPLFSGNNTNFTLGPNLREAASFLTIEEGAFVFSTTPAPFISIAGSNINRSNSFFSLRRSPDNVAAAATLFLNGPLADISNSSITTNRNFVQVLEQATLVQSGSETTPLINTANSTFHIGDPALGTASNDFVVISNNSGASKQGPATVSLSGPLLVDTGSTFDGLNRLLTVSDGSTLIGATTNALVQLSGSNITTGSTVFTLSSGTDQVSPFMSLAGPLLSASNTTFNMGSTFLFIVDSAIFSGPPQTLAGDAAPLMNFNHSTVNGANPLLTVRRSLTPATPTMLNLGGPVLSANNGSAFNLDSTLLNFNENGQLNGLGTGALVQSGAGNSFVLGGNFLTATNASGAGTPGPGTPGPATVNLAGGLLSDTGSTFNIGSRFQNISGGSTVTSSSATDAFVNFNGSNVSTATDFTQVTGSGSTLTLSNSVLSANGTLNIGTDPAAGGDVLDINAGGQLVMNSGSPVLSVTGGTLTVGTADSTSNNTPNRVARLLGVNTSTDASGTFGTDLPIKGNGASFTVPDPFTGGTATAANPIGSLLEATGGANIQVQKGAGDGSSAAIRIDTALFEAAAPIINLVGSLTGQTQLTVGAAADAANANRALDLNAANVMSRGPVIALDKSIINVNNGPLVNLAGSKLLVDANGVAMIKLANGSQINVADLFRLSTASKINVVNGPLVLVDGAGSTLTASGALATFVGAGGGNQIVVNNNIAPNQANPAATAGIPVSGTNITIGAVAGGSTPIRSPGLGTISVNGVAVGTASPNFTGSLIQTTNGGTVKICTKAGGC